MGHYNVPFDKVTGWIPTITIEITGTMPTTSQLEGAIKRADNAVYLALGSLQNINPLDQAVLLETVLDQAALIVSMFAAADAYDAHFPEGARDKNSWSAQLRDQAEDALGVLQEAVQRGTDTPDIDIAPDLGPRFQVPCDPVFADQLRPDFAFVTPGLGGVR